MTHSIIIMILMERSFSVFFSLSLRCMAITGAITSCLGIIIYFLMPDSPKSKWYRLTSSEIDIVEDRMRDNAVVISKNYKFDHIYEALQECRYYCYIGICFLISVISGFITLYSTILISKMGIRVNIKLHTVLWQSILKTTLMQNNI